eukprot:CAMPEP_0183728404 /NCGR_PEP_ID=MMETSP0737-20130205/27981_1 /TAXON_ID=385413 /ORGANISM="Thalassiosira miniscula, Strain CCMP1093" /LENGTH=243 /DNA_ID=CAMNT_0025960339 /DNA_START=30 /DNA_END=760 /DNA_ORIENTATION=+
MSFGKWYDEQKQQQQQGGGASTSSSSLGDSLGLGSLFSNSDNAEEGSSSSSSPDVESQSLLLPNNLSLSSMRSTLESQLPQKIMGMNYQQRFQIFGVCLLLSSLFFGLGFFVGIPLLTVRPQKFALSFTCGSITFMGSFAILKGPYEHMMSMLAYDRIHFTVIYVGSMMMTLYLTFTAGGAKGYILVLAASACQLLAAVVVPRDVLAGGRDGDENADAGALDVVTTGACGVCQDAGDVRWTVR